MELELKLMMYKSILALSADSTSLLRPCDVDRIMDAAEDQGCLKGFRSWLLSHDDLRERTRINAKGFEA